MARVSCKENLHYLNLAVGYNKVRDTDCRKEYRDKAVKCQDGLSVCYYFCHMISFGSFFSSF